MRIVLVLATFVCLILSPYVHAADVVDVHVVDQELTATITVANVYQVRMTITFENALGLTDNAISVQAAQVNPLDVNLTRRFLDSTLVSVPAQLPVQISVSPAAGSSLSFTGVADVELSTSNLAYGSTLRLYKSPAGGTFEDITNFSGVGSYRVRGTSGDFSDFLIVADVRSATQACDYKFGKLQDTLNANANKIAPSMLQNLQAKLDAARTKYQAGLKADAIAQLQSFSSDIKADNGDSIPNIYRANDANTRNVAGILRSQAATLIFSLGS